MSNTRSIQPILGTSYDCRIGKMDVYQSSLVAVGARHPRWATAVQSTFAFVGPLDSILLEVAAKYKRAFQVDKDDSQPGGFSLIFGHPFQDAHSNALQVHDFLLDLTKSIRTWYASSVQPPRQSSTVGKPANSPFHTSGLEARDQWEASRRPESSYS